MALVGATCASCVRTARSPGERPTNISGRDRSRKTSSRRRFSSSIRWRSCRFFTALEISEASTLKRRMSSSSASEAANSLSADSAPMTRPSILTGTQMKETASLAAAASGPVQEQRLHEHVGDDQRLAAFDDLAGDALAELVAALALRLRRHAVGGFNGDLAVRLVEKRDHAAHHAGMFGHDLKHGFEIVGQVGSAVQNLQDLEQQTEFLDLITDLHEPTP